MVKNNLNGGVPVLDKPHHLKPTDSAPTGVAVGRYIFLGEQQMPWGIATSDESATVRWYRSTAPNEEGLPSQLSDLTRRIWDNFEPEHADEIKVAWADCWADGVDRSVICKAKRNGLFCRLNFYRVPPETRIVTFSRWSPGEALTEKQMKVCHLACDGLTTDEIAVNLGISKSAVNEHRKKAMETLGARTPEQLGSFFSLQK